MNRKFYFILAIILSLLITVVQSVIINNKYTHNMTTVYVAIKDIAKDTIITDKCYKLEKVSTKGKLNSFDEKALLNSVACSSIKKGDIITQHDFDENYNINNFRYLALKINGENFNANDIKRYEYVDIFFMPDLEKIKGYQFTWLTNTLEECGIMFNPNNEVGLFIKNVQIEYIDNINNSAQYVSVKVVYPYDQIISFLKTNSIYEFIKINN